MNFNDTFKTLQFHVNNQPIYLRTHIKLIHVALFAKRIITQKSVEIHSLMRLTPSIDDDSCANQVMQIETGDLNGIYCPTRREANTTFNHGKKAMLDAKHDLWFEGFMGTDGVAAGEFNTASFVPEEFLKGETDNG